MAIENARLYESATRWSRQLESLHEVVRSLVEEIELEHLLELVCARLRELIGARLAIIALPDAADGDLTIAAADGEELGTSLVGTHLSRTRSKSGRVLERGHSARLDSVLDDPEVDQEEARRLGARTGLYVPLIARGAAIGIIVVHDKLGRDARFTDGDLRVAEIFAARAAVAVSLSERVARDTVRRVIEAQESERRRLALELHDETGQALTSILLGLKAIRAASGDEAAERAEADLRALVVQALQDVRTLAVELRPAALDDFGLVPALERLAETFAERSGIKTMVEARLDERLSPEIETTLYRVVQEALTNVVKARRRPAREHRRLAAVAAASPRRSTTTGAASSRRRSGPTRSACSGCGSGSRSSAAASRSSRRPSRGRRSRLRCRWRPRRWSEPPGQLMQHARSLQARQAHDDPADEHELQDGETVDADRRVTLDLERRDRGQRHRHRPVARLQLEPVVAQLETAGLRMTVDRPKNCKRAPHSPDGRAAATSGHPRVTGSCLRLSPDLDYDRSAG